ncbi:hypothetical protein BKA61DRAFT_720101 [Leptodontidium sp. MPI-SDFR-AT-0119]|nr:hypothetical protein BKA61DRAFT_720101 [Leptodontidium sp. MPI-SDFR-AT-0119]
MSGVSKVREMICGGSVLDKSTAVFWRKVTNTSVKVNHASTELGGTATTTEPDAQYKHRCIGRPIPGILVKLSDGDSGEILVKSPGMFAHYVGDEAATKAAFDEMVSSNPETCVGSSTAITFSKAGKNIRFRCFEISVLELEERLLGLPCVSEAYILPVHDYDEKGLPAALVGLHTSSRQSCSFSKQKVNLRRIRCNLVARNLERHKLPRLLRILDAGEKVPRTASQKVLKTQALKEFFHIDGYRPVDYRLEGVEFWGGGYNAL